MSALFAAGLLALASVVGAVTPAKATTYDDVRAVDGACQRVTTLAPEQALEVVVAEATRTCIKGQPCRVALRDFRLDHQRFRLYGGDCPVPLSGRFVPTTRRCGGATVYRWQGPLPAGSLARFGMQPRWVGGVAVARKGRKRYVCPPTVPVGAPIIERSARVRSQQVAFPRRAVEQRGRQLKVVIRQGEFHGRLTRQQSLRKALDAAKTDDAGEVVGWVSRLDYDIHQTRRSGSYTYCQPYTVRQRTLTIGDLVLFQHARVPSRNGAAAGRCVAGRPQPLGTTVSPRNHRLQERPGRH